MFYGLYFTKRQTYSNLSVHLVIELFVILVEFLYFSIWMSYSKKGGCVLFQDPQTKCIFVDMYSYWSHSNVIYTFLCVCMQDLTDVVQVCIINDLCQHYGN